jgi:hypothetical protein
MTHTSDEQLAVCIEKWKQFDIHLNESIPIRETVWQLKMRVDLLEKSVLHNAVIGGLIGALIGSGASPAVMHVINIMFGIH